MKSLTTTLLQLEMAYATRPGQRIFVTGNHPQLGAGDPQRALPLLFLDAQHWGVEVPLALNKKFVLNYSYFVLHEDGSRSFEGGLQKQVVLHPGDRVYSKDTWITASWMQNALTTAPFRDVFFKNDFVKDKALKQPPTSNTFFRVAAPGLGAQFSVGLLGNHTAIGAWDLDKVIPMQKDGAGSWTVAATLPADAFPIAYKYVIINKKSRKLVAFEDGDNRWLHGPSAALKAVAQDGYVRLPPKLWRGAGVAIPVFSLRTNDRYGVGTFTDLVPFVDWATSVGLQLIQLLPVNDTTATHTWTDSYPYAAISAFALHPLYADVHEIAQFMGVTLSKGTLKQLAKKQHPLDPVDYEAVTKAKQVALREVFAAHTTILEKDTAYKAFVKANTNWLFAYAAFCFFRDQYGTAVFVDWPTNQTYDEQALKKLLKKDPDFGAAIAYHYFVQYHLDRQLQQAHEYAKANGVVFKGDLPIGIYRHSADAWQNPALYHMNRQAGAPPDDFAIKGQNWGFPTYNWERMAADDFLWWQRRFAQMQRYYDAFRIDHILGFFRIWSIPMHAVEGIMGFFEPALPVALHDFAERYIAFDYQRMVQPHLTADFLQLRFGKDAEKIAAHFMVERADGTFALQAEFDTQQKVAAYCAQHNAFASFQEGLFDCISNVLLFEAPDGTGQHFHFRFNMQHTYSFQQLPLHLQSSLKALYDDYFYVRQDALWRNEALQKLPRLKFATSMLVCGE
ncbi:MAG: 4-alpha-glucanotransferase, partial [Schleiferiaceae bacterium]|nr:4-alpha-glucanotransferase [Schleiferiaceae bacterium]